MKTTILLSLMMTGVSFAAFEKWTNKDGKTADLELVGVTESGGEKAGEFKMRNGKTVTLKISDLAEADAKRLGEWKPPSLVEFYNKSKDYFSFEIHFISSDDDEDDMEDYIKDKEMPWLSLKLGNYLSSPCVLLPGHMVSDNPAVLGSLDFVMGECDR